MGDILPQDFVIELRGQCARQCPNSCHLYREYLNGRAKAIGVKNQDMETVATFMDFLANQYIRAHCQHRLAVVPELWYLRSRWTDFFSHADGGAST